MTTGVQNRWPRPKWLRALAGLCILGVGYLIGISVTGVVIFFLNVPLSESAAKWLSAALAVALTIWFATWRRSTWLAEDRRAP